MFWGRRDLKPGNVLLSNVNSPRPLAKLTDFGLSRLRSTVLVTRHPEAGTPAYMPPEAFDASNYVITHKADIYSLGAYVRGRAPLHPITTAPFQVSHAPPSLAYARRLSPHADAPRRGACGQVS